MLSEKILTTTLLTVQTRTSYRWAMLALCTFTALTVITLPNMSLPPLFATIAADLNLTLVEIGAIWGTMSFTGIFFSLIGGTLGDRFGTRRTLFVCCLLTGLMGMTRAFAVDFNTLLITSLLFGVSQAIIPIMIFKVARQWFSSDLGMASGVISSGFAAGLTLGPLLSTSLILPALGGWRQVIVFYGGIAVLMSLAWLVIHPAEDRSATAAKPQISLRQSFGHVVRLRNIWVLGIGALGVNACFNGFTGYLPTYLKAIGWAELDADRALSAFFITSLACVIPLSILSDRLRQRRYFLIAGSVILSTGIGSLAFVQGGQILLIVAFTGFCFDAFMAILNASLLEVEGVGYLYAGTALGFANMIRNLGGTFSPPIGNSLASIAPNVPFLFWGALGLLGVFMFSVLYKHKRSTSHE